MKGRGGVGGGRGGGRVVYAERTWAPWWIHALMWGACGAAAVAAPWALLFPALMTAVFLRLDAEVRTDRLVIAFGPLHVVRKVVAFAEIEEAEAVSYRPLRDFGGWGIRPRGNRTAWTIRGSRAVRVKLRGGREVYVGSRFPQRLAERIRSVLPPSRSPSRPPRRR